MQHHQHPIVADLLARLDANQREAFEERAAIIQFDGQVERGQAEALALLDVLHHSITALQVELDGGTEWLVTTDLTFARQHLNDIGGKEIGVVDLATVINQQYGGVAFLTTVG